MDGKAHIEQVDALAGFQRALVRFQGTADAALIAAEQAIRTEIDWLVTLCRQQHDIVDDCERAVEFAERELDDCLYDDDYDCSSYYEGLFQAKRDRRSAQDRLNLIESWLKRIERQAASCRSSCRGMRLFSGISLSNAIKTLGRHHLILDGYRSSSSPPSEHMLGSSGEVSAGRPPTANQLAPEDEYRRIPGIQDVPIAKISFEKLPVRGAEDFEKVPLDVMMAGARKLAKIVRPAVQSGHGKSYFRQLDARAGVSSESSALRVFEAFYGDRPIILNKVGDSYTIRSGGRHRIYAAQVAGLDTIPALVYEQIPGQEDRES